MILLCLRGDGEGFFPPTVLVHSPAVACKARRKGAFDFFVRKEGRELLFSAVAPEFGNAITDKRGKEEG